MAKFTEIKVTNIEGVEEVIDFSKTIGNALYINGKDVNVCESGKKIYYGEDVELTDDVKETIRQHISQYPYILRTALETVLE